MTITHAANGQIKDMIANVRAGLDAVLITAPQLTKPARWKALVLCIVNRITAAKSKIYPPQTRLPSIASGLASG